MSEFHVGQGLSEGKGAASRSEIRRGLTYKISTLDTHTPGTPEGGALGQG